MSRSCARVEHVLHDRPPTRREAVVLHDRPPTRREAVGPGACITRSMHANASVVLVALVACAPPPATAPAAAPAPRPSTRETPATSMATGAFVREAFARLARNDLAGLIALTDPARDQDEVRRTMIKAIQWAKGRSIEVLEVRRWKPELRPDTFLRVRLRIDNDETVRLASLRGSYLHLLPPEAEKVRHVDETLERLRQRCMCPIRHECLPPEPIHDYDDRDAAEWLDPHDEQAIFNAQMAVAEDCQ